MYDVLIIGAGPGGIFSAYELMERKPDLKIAVFEVGHPLEHRKCPIDGDKIKSCIHCKCCSIMSGFGGAGAFSDGKYNITNDFGGTLYEYIGKKTAIELMKYVDGINLRFGGEGTKLYSTAGTKFKKTCMQHGHRHLRHRGYRDRRRRRHEQRHFQQSIPHLGQISERTFQDDAEALVPIPPHADGRRARGALFAAAADVHL